MILVILQLEIGYKKRWNVTFFSSLGQNDRKRADDQDIETVVVLSWCEWVSTKTVLNQPVNTLISA